jgi:hypothetical protein
MWALFNPPFVAADFKVNPQGRLNSGHMDMMWIEGLTGLGGRLKALEVQLKAQQGLHITEDCVTLNKVRRELTDKQCALHAGPLAYMHSPLRAPGVWVCPSWSSIALQVRSLLLPDFQGPPRSVVDH